MIIVSSWHGKLSYDCVWTSKVANVRSTADTDHWALGGMITVIFISLCLQREQVGKIWPIRLRYLIEIFGIACFLPTQSLQALERVRLTRASAKTREDPPPLSQWSLKPLTGSQENPQLNFTPEEGCCKSRIAIALTRCAWALIILTEWRAKIYHW